MAPAYHIVGLLLGAAYAQDAQILSCVAGLPKCLGVPDVTTAAAWRCATMNITDCSGQTTPETCDACIPPRRLQLRCPGKNTTGQDGTPVTFSLPVDVTTVKAEYFQWIFPDGSKRKPSCAIPGGRPANEANELQTIAIVGNAGGWGDFAVGLEIVGDLMLVKPDGSKVSAKGLHYSGRSLDVDGGLWLMTAKYEVFSKAGETLRNAAFRPKVYPNHCQHLFPETTHRIVLLFDGGVTYDGRRSIMPDDTDLFQIFAADGTRLPADGFLGLADLGSTIPKKQCERDTYDHDQDNYLDICLKMAANTPLPAYVHMPCDESTQMSMPKGKAYPCKPQTVNVSVQDGFIVTV